MNTETRGIPSIREHLMLANDIFDFRFDCRQCRKCVVSVENTTIMWFESQMIMLGTINENKVFLLTSTHISNFDA